MKTHRYALLLVALALVAADLVVAPAAAAQDRGRAPATISTRMDTTRTTRANRQADVLLEVPTLRVDSIGLKVEQLDARLSLDARVANLVQLRAGADVSIGSVELTILGVEAEAYLHVYLDDVVTIVNRTLETLDNNPEILTMLGETVQQTVGTVGDVAGQALGPGGAVSGLTEGLGQTLGNVTRPGGLLSQTVNGLGQTVTRTLGQTGSLTESVFDSAGRMVNQRTLGKLTDLKDVVKETTNAAGSTVRQVRDDGGNLFEYTIDTAGRVTDARVVQKARDGR